MEVKPERSRSMGFIKVTVHWVKGVGGLWKPSGITESTRTFPGPEFSNWYQNIRLSGVVANMKKLDSEKSPYKPFVSICTFTMVSAPAVAFDFTPWNQTRKPFRRTWKRPANGPRLSLSNVRERRLHFGWPR